MNKTLILSSFNVKAKCSVLEGQVLEHVLRLGKIEVLSARARYRAPNARALLIIEYYDKINLILMF